MNSIHLHSFLHRLRMYHLCNYFARTVSHHFADRLTYGCIEHCIDHCICGGSSQNRSTSY